MIKLNPSLDNCFLYSYRVQKYRERIASVLHISPNPGTSTLHRTFTTEKPLRRLMLRKPEGFVLSWKSGSAFVFLLFPFHLV
jgi:hypothetical protein